MNLSISTAAPIQKQSFLISFSLFFAWLLSLPFEGQILYSLAENAQIDETALVLTAVFLHFCGLFTSGFFIKRQAAAKVTMIVSTVVCIAGSLIFFLPFSALWYISITAIAFFAGLFLASWGFYYKMYVPLERRLQTAADVLIYSNVIMIFVNVVTVNISVFIGLGISIVLLLMALFLAFRLETCLQEQRMPKIYPGGLFQSLSAILKPFIFLCLFILIITINSGLMYQVVNPAFAHYPLLASYYWAIPYIAVLLILRNLPAKTRHAYILYVALTMIGLSYVLFMWLDRSITSYLLIDTLMLGAFGVCDLFWWSILGSIFEYTDNPVQVFGWDCR